MSDDSTVVDSMEAGPLGVLHLKRLWDKLMSRRAGRHVEEDKATEWPRDMLVLDGLGVPLEGTFQYVFQIAPSYDEFEQWILEKNGGSIAPLRIERINAIISGREYSDELRREIDEIENAEPVLSDEDLASWHENGYVVAREAITQEQCEATAQAIWEFVGGDPKDPDTWYEGRSSIFVPLYHHPALWANRRAPRVHKAYAQVWGTADLWPSVDRCSLNPPEREGWRFPGPSLHWDTSLVPPIRFGVQGIVYLTDTEGTQGAFTCVPGFHRRIDEWLDSLPPDANPREQDLMSLGARPVPANAGDLIIWHQALPHGGSPNRSARPRLVQFLDMNSPRREYTTAWR